MGFQNKIKSGRLAQSPLFGHGSNEEMSYVTGMKKLILLQKW
jgi:hypothetical protein